MRMKYFLSLGTKHKIRKPEDRITILNQTESTLNLKLLTH